MTEQTSGEYKQVIQACKDIFEKKTRDYGTAWRVLRLPSITDQILIKAQRIRSIQEKGIQRVDDSVRNEFAGIVNYGIIALMQSELSDRDDLDLSFEQVEPYYNSAAEQAMALFEDKNHDYGEAWRDMRISSITDIILMKLRRIKQIEDNNGLTLISEGLAANYMDIINYAVFCLIKQQKEDEAAIG